MANAKYDFAVGRYALFNIGDGGPIRLEGHTAYGSHSKAIDAAEKHLRASRCNYKVTIFRVKSTHWLDPKPIMLCDLPKSIIKQTKE